MKYLLLLCALAMFANAQNCAQKNQCHIVQQTPSKVVAENGHNVCVFVAINDEQVYINCQTNQVSQFHGTISFFQGDCKGSNYLGDTDIKWSLCRIGKGIFSWDITDDSTFELAGTII